MVAFSSTILAIPMMIEKVKRKSQNSRFLVASLKPQFLPLLLRKRSVSEGVEIILFMELLLIIESEMGGIKRFIARMTIRSLEPQKLSS